VSRTDATLRIGFIPLADAAARIVAADRGIAAAPTGPTMSSAAR
jgi:hypothetical protein